MTPISSAEFAILVARVAANRGDLPAKRDRSRDEEQEAILQGQVEKWLTGEGAWYHHDRDRRKEEAGVPDLLICWCGKFVAVELKSKTGKVETPQKEKLAMIRKAGGRVFVARSLEEFVAKLSDEVNEKEPR